MTVHGSPYEGVRHGAHTTLAAHGNRCPAAGTTGFTMVEILVAILLTAFGILGFTGLLKVIGGVEAEDTWRTKSLFCAQERMEELAFASVTGGGVASEGVEDLAEGTYQGIRREWTVGDSAVFDGLLEIHVECAYPWKGSTKSVELSTLVFPEG